MNEHEQEGVIKFRQVFQKIDPPRSVHLTELREWRNRLRQLELIGVHPNGEGYGNLSHRLPDSAEGSLQFVITGTQTSSEDYLGAELYTTVLDFDIGQNVVVVGGHVLASSESLTHAIIFQANDAVRYVFHAHNPEIWTARHELGLLETHPDVPYGTTQMAEEVRRLFRDTDLQARGIFAMAGHQDGIISFGATATDAGSLLRTYLTRARDRLDQAGRLAPN